MFNEAYKKNNIWKTFFTNPEQKDWAEILKRPGFDSLSLEETVASILADVKLNGDAAVKKYAAKFDGVELNDFKVTASEIKEAVSLVGNDLKKSIQQAKENIEKFSFSPGAIPRQN